VFIAQDYLDGGNYTEAKAYLLKALKVSQDIGDKNNTASAYDKLAYLYEMQGDLSEATKIRYEYLKVNEEIGDESAIIAAIYALADNFELLGNKTEALKYYKKGLREAVKAGEKITAISFNGSIGNMYATDGKYTEAAMYYTDGQRLAEEVQNVTFVAAGHQDIGNLFRIQANYTGALKHYQLAETGFVSVANNHDLAALYSQMGMTYTHLKKYKQAKASFEKAMLLYRRIDSKQRSMIEHYNGMRLLDSATGNWKAAYQHFQQYVTLRDSSFNKETLKKAVASQMKYESDKKEANIKAEQEKKDVLTLAEIKRQRNILYSSFAVLATVLVFSIVAYRQRNKLAREKKRSDLLLMDKELLLKEIHHRVKNNLEVVSSLLALQSAQIDDPNTKEAMLAGQNRVHSIGIVHQKLYQGTNLGAIEMKDYFINLSESILDSFGAEKRVTIECAMDQLDVDIDTAVPLGLIVNELLTNTLKYAFPEGQPGKVQIKLQKQTDGALHLEVSDNGVGKSGFTHGTGFGGQLVSLLTQQLSGSMREETKDGTHIYFEFKPVKAA
jgi:two-component system, sensor histidine kinase PdtaS